ncbi:hypothetical protein LNP74_28045 [Klebsiella pneumoniae subsp. pneumoniae]|nr:hypothetical protein [Klebsiella pneumoniae subsp. pneumoniae]
MPGGVVNLTKRPQFSQQGPSAPDRRHAKIPRRGAFGANAISLTGGRRLIGTDPQQRTRYPPALRICFLLLAAGQRHLAAAARLSAKDPSGGYHGSFAAGRHRYAHNGVKALPRRHTKQKAIGDGYKLPPGRSTARNLTTSSPTSGRSIPHPIPTSSSIRSAGRLRMDDCCSDMLLQLRAVISRAVRWTTGQPISIQRRAIPIQATWRTPSSAPNIIGASVTTCGPAPAAWRPLTRLAAPPPDIPLPARRQ